MPRYRVYIPLLPCLGLGLSSPRMCGVVRGYVVPVLFIDVGTSFSSSLCHTVVCTFPSCPVWVLDCGHHPVCVGWLCCTSLVHRRWYFIFKFPVPHCCVYISPPALFGCWTVAITPCVWSGACILILFIGHTSLTYVVCVGGDIPVLFTGVGVSFAIFCASW